MNLYRSLQYFVLGMVFLSSCKVTRPFESPDLTVMKTDSLYRGSSTTDTTTIDDISWQELFTDPKLQQLITEGLANNPDMNIAIERIHESQALLIQSKHSFFSLLSFSTTVIISQTCKY